MKYRKLTSSEIDILTKNSCTADSWSNINVTDQFTPQNIKSVIFSGENYLGNFSGKAEVRNKKFQAGISNAHIHNCTIEDNCYIKNIGTVLADYVIEEKTTICNVDSIFMSGDSSFGNGTIISSVNEAGGREIPIYEDLSVHTAYLLVFYRYKEDLIRKIINLINDISLKKKSARGLIQAGSQLYNCGTIENVKIESFAFVDGASFMKNGTIRSSQIAPTTIGNNTYAQNFIILHGSTINNGVTLQNCFVGQGCEIANFYTAENSLFFANSQCLQGEACSIFAGPYTVTHHKSTLLIAGYYSFFNAGSGTNQSNHMYKLGPVHQGIIERGCKTGSDSYILWPAHIAPFTMVLGRHYGNPDIAYFPFSYLIEEEGKSVLMPAQNIFSVGTSRDTEKWKNRDKRKHDIYTDFIITEALNPYTINLIIKGIKILDDLQTKSTKLSKTTIYKGTLISTSSIPRALRMYDQAILKYTGDILISYLKKNSIEDLEKDLQTIQENENWIDFGGLICPQAILKEIEELCNKGEDNFEDLNNIYLFYFNLYENHKYKHALQLLKEYFKVDPQIPFKENIINMISNWMDNNLKIISAIAFDAKKEYNEKSKTGFGIDSDSEFKNMEFKIVRGELESNSFFNTLNNNINNLNTEGEKIIQMLK